MTRGKPTPDVLRAQDQISEAEALVAVIGSIDLDDGGPHPLLQEGLYLLARETEKRLTKARELLDASRVNQ
jgi:hypothetical protein